MALLLRPQVVFLGFFLYFLFSSQQIVMTSSQEEEEEEEEEEEVKATRFAVPNGNVAVHQVGGS